jgi:hypothetical protein
VLTDDELESLRAAFAEIETLEARPPICASAVFDPCIIDVFGWDDFTVDDYEHSAPRLGHDTVATLLDVLNALILPTTAGR